MNNNGQIRLDEEFTTKEKKTMVANNRLMDCLTQIKWCWPISNGEKQQQ